MLDKEKIIQEVARKHRILLDSNDPILVTVSINDIILSQYIEKIDTSLEDLAETIEGISASYINQCQTVGEAVVGSAVTNAKKEIAGTANEIKDQFSKLLNEHLEKQQHLIVQGNIIKKSVKISALVIAISCIATVAVILMT